MNKILTAFIFLLMVFCISYAGGVSNDEGIPKVDYYYKLSDSEAESLIKQSREIVKGEAYDSVIKKLGSPDVSKPIHGKRINSPITGRIARYYIAQHDEGLVNELLDEYVMIVFDADDTVIEVTYMLSKANKVQ